MTTNAAPLSAGMAAKKSSKDFSEPAEPPNPTTGMPEEPLADSVRLLVRLARVTGLTLNRSCVKLSDFRGAFGKGRRLTFMLPRFS